MENAVDFESLMLDSLHELGLRSITTIRDKAEIFPAMEKTEYVLVCLDGGMLKVGGAEIIRDMKKRWPKTIVIILSIASHVDLFEDLIMAGAEDLIVKSYTKGKIKELISQVLEVHL